MPKNESTRLTVEVDKVSFSYGSLKAVDELSVQVPAGISFGLLGFFVFALPQTLIVLLFTIYVLDVHYYGDMWQIFIFQIFVIVVAVNLGIFTSTFARNEFQMVQFIPLILFP